MKFKILRFIYSSPLSITLFIIGLLIYGHFAYDIQVKLSKIPYDTWIMLIGPIVLCVCGLILEFINGTLGEKE